MTPKRWMLSVGVSDYGSQPGLPDLPQAVNDAGLVFATLDSEYNFQGRLLVHGRDLASGPHRSLVNQSCGVGTKEELIDQLDALRPRMSAEDTFVFFYAGRSAVFGDFALLPYGASPEDLKSVLFLREWLGAITGLPCRQVLLFLNCDAPSQFPPSKSVETNGEREAMILAAGAVAPMSGRRRADSPYSPFGAAIHRYLREELRCGDVVNVGELLTFVRQHGCPAASLHQSPIRPSGIDGSLGIRRPQFRVHVEVPRPPSAGELLELVINVESLTGDVSPPQTKLFHIEVLPNGDRWRREWNLSKDSFACAGDYILDCVVTDPATGEETTRTISITVGEGVEKPFTLDSSRLPPCLKGKLYEARITINGGQVPFGKLELRGTGVEFLKAELHQGTSATDRPCIMLRGLAAEDPCAGTAQSPDDAPTAYELRIALCDARGESASARYRLLVFSTNDYCHISGGEFEVGYSPNLPQNQAITEMLTGLAQKVTDERLAVPRDMQRVLGAIGKGMADEIVKEIGKANPGCKVELPEFYIRRYPVTNRAWREYVRANLHVTPPPHVPPQWLGASPDFFAETDASLPVVNLEYNHICAYLAWKGTRLPTAWEWERAARGARGKLFPWGDKFDSSKCNMKESGNDALTPVDKYDPHYGPDQVRDMVGNAAEWVDRRVFSGGYLYQPFRGGSFRDLCLYALPMRDSMEVGIRYGTDEDIPEVGETAFDWLGFRDVIDLDPDPQEEQALLAVPEVCLHPSDRREIRVAPFAMACYAVSNLEYWEFVRATHHRRPENWKLQDDPPFPAHHRHLPVVHVTYRDALAFCLWKSRAERRMIRLPSAEQWLAAVDGGEGWRFPWGNEFNLQRCNSMRSGWGKRLPVFALRAGQSKHGIYNLIGNVCEWITPFEVRGGGWQDDSAEAADGGFRFRVQQTQDAEFLRNDVGFRYVALDRKGMNPHA